MGRECRKTTSLLFIKSSEESIDAIEACIQDIAYPSIIIIGVNLDTSLKFPNQVQCISNMTFILSGKTG